MRIGVNSGSLEKDLIDKYGFPCPEAMVEERPAAHRDGRDPGLPADDRQPEGQPRADGRRVLHPVRGEVRLSHPRRNHRGRLARVRHAQERRGHRRDPLAGHRRHDSRLAPGRPRSRDRCRLRHPPRLRPPGHQARGRRLPDLRPARHRPGADRRRGRRQDEKADPTRFGSASWAAWSTASARPRKPTWASPPARARASSSSAAYRSATSRKTRWSRLCSRKSRGSTRKPNRWPRTWKKKSRRQQKTALTVLG